MLLVILCLALIMGSPTIAGSATLSYTLQTSWPASDVGFIVSDGNTLWGLASSGVHVTHYGAAGELLGGWDTHTPSGTFATGRGIGVDGNGFVYVLSSTFESGGLVQKFQDDGTLTSSFPSPVPYNLGFAVDPAGTIYGGDPDDDDVKELVTLGQDGTYYFRFRHCCFLPIDAEGPGVTMVPSGERCARTQSNCFWVSAAAATSAHLFISANWCNDSGECVDNTRVYGPGAQVLTIIPTSARVGLSPTGGLAFGADNTLFVLTDTGTIEKWVPSSATRTPSSSWGAVKAVWR